MHKNDDNKHQGHGFAISILIGTAVGFVLVLILFAIFASIIASGKMSEELMKPITIAAAFLGAVIGAICAVKRHRAKIMTVGLTVGALMFLITFAGALLSGEGLGGSLILPFLIAFAAGGIAGGMLNLRRKKHKRA